MAAKSFFQTLRRFIKKPWEITGPQSDPEYLSALPKATEYRRFCPATTPIKPIIPTSETERVFDITYYTRDPRRNRPPMRRTVLKKDDIPRFVAAQCLEVGDLPKPYVPGTIEEDDNAIGGGYQK